MRKLILRLSIFLLGFLMVILGKNYIGYLGLSIQLIGLSLILLSLYLYNKEYI